MPIFFPRNLDPFGDKSLKYSWTFTNSDGSGTLNSQQKNNNLINVSDSSSSIIDTTNTIKNYNVFKSDDGAEYNSENDIISSDYTNVTLSVIIDCNIQNTDSYKIVPLGGEGQDGNIIINVDNNSNSSTTNHLSILLLDGDYGTSTHYQYDEDLDLGYHTIGCAYDDDDTNNVDVYVDGVYKASITIDDVIYFEDNPVIIRNTSITTYGITDILIFTAYLNSDEMLKIHENSFIGLADRTLDPFNDGSLTTAFRGIDNSTSDDELIHLFDNVLPTPI